MCLYAYGSFPVNACVMYVQGKEKKNIRLFSNYYTSVLNYTRPCVFSSCISLPLGFLASLYIFYASLSISHDRSLTTICFLFLPWSIFLLFSHLSSYHSLWLFLSVWFLSPSLSPFIILHFSFLFVLLFFSISKPPYFQLHFSLFQFPTVKWQTITKIHSSLL